MQCGCRKGLTLEALPYIIDFLMSLRPFLAAILDHCGSLNVVGKSRDSCSHFVMTGECGGSGRKCALNVATKAYSPGSKHDGGAEVPKMEGADQNLGTGGRQS